MKDYCSLYSSRDSALRFHLLLWTIMAVYPEGERLFTILKFIEQSSTNLAANPKLQYSLELDLVQAASMGDHC